MYNVNRYIFIGHCIDSIRQAKGDLMEKRIFFPSSLNNNLDTYNFLSKIQNELIDSTESTIILDFTRCTFSHAIFTSYIGALTNIGKAFGKTIKYETANGSKLQDYFRNSGLYDHIMQQPDTHSNQNAIPFTSIDFKDDSRIIEYIDNILELAPIRLTEQGHEVLFKNIYEIFNNSVDHSRANHGVYACGHWMPKKKYLSFSVYDTGIGIPALIKERIDSTLSSESALLWALKRGNSTQQLIRGTPRGLGLSDLQDLIRLNDGSLTIFSNDVYYQYNNRVDLKRLALPTMGTFIGITIIADYNHIYTTK